MDGILRLCDPAFRGVFPFFSRQDAKGAKVFDSAGPPGCDLLDASRLWNNLVHADGVIIPSK